MVKVAGWANLFMAFAYAVRVATLLLWSHKMGYYILPFFAPFGLAVTIPVEGALICLSLLVAIGLLKGNPSLRTYSGVTLCLLAIVYQGLWGVKTFNLAYKMEFILISVAIPLATLFIYGLLLTLLLQLARRQESEA
jgi:hypothetical protein